jgi:hypothetical protein
MDTVNAKKRPFTGVSTIFERDPRSDLYYNYERASFLKIIDINDISFFATSDLLLFYSVRGNVNSMVSSVLN